MSERFKTINVKPSKEEAKELAKHMIAGTGPFAPEEEKVYGTKAFVKGVKENISKIEDTDMYSEKDVRQNIRRVTKGISQEIGQNLTEVGSTILEKIPENIKEETASIVQEGLTNVSERYQEGLEFNVENKLNPLEYVVEADEYLKARQMQAVGKGLEQVGTAWDFVMRKGSNLTGVDRPWLEIGEFFVPYSKIFKAAKFLKTAKTVDTVADTAKIVDKVADTSKIVDKVADTSDLRGAEFAFKAQQRSPVSVTSFDDFVAELGERHFLKTAKTSKNISKNYPMRKLDKWQKMLKDITKTGDDMRRASAVFLTSGFGPGDYKQFSKYISKNWGGPVTSAITNIHHVGFLEKLKRIPLAHRSFQTIKNAAKAGQVLESPIVMQLRKMGVELGNFAQNTADVLETLTAGSRSFKVDAVFDQFGGTMNRQTIHDLFQGTWLSKGVGEISEKTKSDMDAFRALSKEFPKRKGDVFPQSSIETSTQVKGDKFPTIKIRDPKIPFDRRKPNLGVIEEWTPENWNDWENRFQIVSDKLGIKNKYNRKAIEIPINLDIYSNDHSLVHKLTELAEKTEGNPVYVAQQAVESGAIRNMDIDLAAKLQYESLNSMEKILGNVLQRRVEKVVELFEELNPGKLFTDLLPEEQQIFFRANVNKIATKGGFRDKALTLTEALKPVKGDLTLLENLFGFTPQTFK